MMKKIIVIFFLCILSSISFSQGDFTFKKIIHLPFGGFATSVKQTLDEGYIVCGAYYLSSSASQNGSFLMKLSKDGTTQWYKEFPPPLYFFRDLTLDLSGNIYVLAAEPDSVGSTNVNIIIIKLTSSGIVLWSKSYGGSNADAAYSIDFTTDNNILLSGTTESYASTGAGATSYTLKIDLNGNLLWNKFFIDPVYNLAFQIKELYPNKYVSIGRYSTSNYGGFSVFDNNGNLLVSKSIEYPNFSVLSSVTQYKNGGYLIAGTTGSWDLCPFLVALDSGYNFLWAKKYFPPISITSEFISIHKIVDGNYITSFEPEGVNGNPKSMGIMKLDSAGTIIWGKIYEQNNYTYPFKLIVAKDSGYVEVGFIQKIYPPGLQQPFIIKTNNFGEVNGCISDTIVTSGSINVVPTITSYGSVSSACIVNNTTLSNTFVSRLDSIYCIDSVSYTIGIEQYLINNEVIVYPNPVLSETTFSLSTELKKGVLNIFDVTGKKISSKDFSGLEVNFNRNQLPSGMYFYTIGSENKIIAKGKLIFR